MSTSATLVVCMLLLFRKSCSHRRYAPFSGLHFVC